jgi:hypothetical protein
MYLLALLQGPLGISCREMKLCCNWRHQKRKSRWLWIGFPERSSKVFWVMTALQKETMSQGIHLKETVIRLGQGRELPLALCTCVPSERRYWSFFIFAFISGGKNNSILKWTWPGWLSPFCALLLDLSACKSFNLKLERFAWVSLINWETKY